MRLAAGLPVRLRPGQSRRLSSACAAARPGPPAEQSTRWPGFSGDREHRQPPRAAQARPHTEDHPHDRESSAVRCVPRLLAGRQCLRSGGRRLWVQLEQPGPLLPPDTFHLGQSRRFHARAPRHQPEPSSARPRGQRPPSASGGPVPGPDSSLANNRCDTGHPPERRAGLVPSRVSIKATRRNWALLSSRAIPALSPGRRRACQAPGLPLPARGRLTTTRCCVRWSNDSPSYRGYLLRTVNAGQH